MSFCTRGALHRTMGGVVAAITLASPCPRAFAQAPPPPIVHREEPFLGSPVTDWDYDLDGNGRTDLRKQDIDGDGVVDRYLKNRNADDLFDLTVPKAAPDGAPQRHLIVRLDSVPFAVMERLWREGHFRDFHPPGRVIGAFPSDPSHGLAEVFGLPAASFGGRRFDRALDRIVPGARGMGAPFDYDELGARGFADRLFGGAGADRRLSRCMAAFLRLDREKPAGEPIVLSVGSTAEIVRREGREGLVRRLLEVERMIDEIFFRAGGGIRVSLFSTNGAALSPSVPLPDLRGRLARSGFSLAASLKGQRDFVVPDLGPTGGFRAYVAGERRAAAAEALASLEGIDFSAYVAGDACVVEGPRGKARITRDGARYRYALLSGDPLGLGGIMAGMRRDGVMDDDGFADDDAWLRATRECARPDIIRRLANAVTGGGDDPDLFVSVADGFCLDGGFFAPRGGIRGVSGSASEAQTVGMAMSSAHAIPPFVRASELMGALGGPAPRGAATATPTATATESPTPRPTATPAATGTATPSPSPTPSASPTATATTAPPPPTAPPAPSASPTPVPSTGAIVDNAGRPVPPPAAALRPSPRPTRTRRPIVRALRRTPRPRRSPSAPRTVPPPSNVQE